MKNRITVIETIATEQRRKTVAQLLQQSLTETQIAQRLGVNKSTIIRDIAELKQQSLRFIYDLAKQDLAFFYSNTIQDINRARIEAWKIYQQAEASDNKNRNDISDLLRIDKPCTSNNRDKLNALKIIIQANESMFNLLQQGPTVMAVKALTERVEKLEQNKAELIAVNANL
jgi:predicted transcriptional regulator